MKAFAVTLFLLMNLASYAEVPPQLVNQMNKKRFFTDRLVEAANLTEASYKTGTSHQSNTFDFLIGEYQLKVQNHDLETGEVLSHRIATMKSYYLEPQRMLANEWTGFDLNSHSKVQFGMNLRTFVPADSRWNTVWLADGQAMPGASFSFVDEGDQIAARFEYEYPEVGTVSTVLRFFNITENTFEWDHQVSLDGGETWDVLQTHVGKKVE